MNSPTVSFASLNIPLAFILSTVLEQDAVLEFSGDIVLGRLSVVEGPESASDLFNGWIHIVHVVGWLFLGRLKSLIAGFTASLASPPELVDVLLLSVARHH